MTKGARVLLFSWCWAVLLLSASAAPALSQSSQTKPQIQRRNSSTARMESIVREVRHELVMMSDYDVFDWLEGEVKPDGTVILRGEVVRPTLKSGAEKKVKEIESVSKVVNEIRVLPLSSFDDDIRIAVYRALFNRDSPVMRYGLRSVPPIHIIVENGRVTLKGIVATQMDRQLAETAARGVPNTLEVNNELKVEKAASN